jgi:two-component system alkaline phosphatase synthesis response regulator PhoP
VGLELGGDDYVTKPYNPREVVARVRARLRVQKGLQGGEGVLKIGRLSLNPNRREVWIDSTPITLTATEFDILHTLMTRAGYVMTRRELIRKALGDDYEGIERTLDSHVRNLRRKMEADNSFPRYVQTVYGVGYRLEEVAA